MNGKPTGGSGRIEHGVDMLKAGRGKRMLVAGADPAVTKQDLIRRLGGNGKQVHCCVDLGSESVDTRSNAEEAERWLAKHRYRSFRLVTSDWHMRRTAVELASRLPADITVLRDAVPTQPSFITLVREYHKLLAAWLLSLV